MWTKQRTRQGDTLSTLARSYGISMEKILLANGVTPPSKHTSGYLTQKAREYLIPANLPRKVMSKLVLEYDIQRWVRSIGGDCEALRHGSQAQTKHLLACVPGHYCRFTRDTAINLPHRMRALSGLGAASSADLAMQFNAVRASAETAADAVVSGAGVGYGSDAEEWRSSFLAQVNDLAEKMAKKDSSGRYGFERDPTKASRLAEVISSEVAIAIRQFPSLSTIIAKSLNNLRSQAVAIADAVAQVFAETPSTPSAPAAPDTAALSSVRAGTITLTGRTKAPYPKSTAHRQLQELLKKALPPSELPKGFKVDSEFGPKTTAAVKTFQKRAGLPQNGVVDQAVMQALDAAVASYVPAGGRSGAGASGGGARGKSNVVPTTFSLADVRAGKSVFVRGQSGPGIAEAAAFIMSKVPVSTGTPVDIFGPEMEAAVKTAQTAAKVQLTGKVDQATVVALDKLPNLTSMTTTSGKSNTLIYVGVGAALLLLLAGGATAAKKRRSIAAV